MTNRLTPKQKWQLAFRLLLLYTPVLMYVNMPAMAKGQYHLTTSLPFFLASVVIALGMYFVWVTATDWMQQRLFRRYGQAFLSQSSWAGMVLPILIATGLAVLFIITLRLVMKPLVILLFSASPLPPAPTVPPEVIPYLERANNGFFVAIMISIFYLTMNTRSYQQLKNVQLRAERLEKEAATSQFEALKNQISPHFLFNSLSILTSLVHEDANLSEQFIKQLSKAYRYILEQKDQALVPLGTELDFIRAYTFLLQMRFENKFAVSVEVPPDRIGQYRIAPLSLQMLVENAVKHNRMSVREPLRVRIRQEDEYLVIQNPIQPRDQPEISTGLGLRNIINRYCLLTDHQVWYGEQEGSFVVKIPLLS